MDPRMANTISLNTLKFSKAMSLTDSFKTPGVRKPFRAGLIKSIASKGLKILIESVVGNVFFRR